MRFYLLPERAQQQFTKNRKGMVGVCMLTVAVALAVSVLWSILVEPLPSQYSTAAHTIDGNCYYL